MVREVLGPSAEDIKAVCMHSLVEALEVVGSQHQKPAKKGHTRTHIWHLCWHLYQSFGIVDIILMTVLLLVQQVWVRRTVA